MKRTLIALLALCLCLCGCGKKEESGEKAAEEKFANSKPGTVLWEFETKKHAVHSSPAIGSDGTVYVGSDDDKLYAIKTDSKGPAKSP